MKRFLLQLISNTRGATSIEYVLIAALIGLVTIPALMILTPQINATYERVVASVGSDQSDVNQDISPDLVVTHIIDFNWSESFQDWFTRPADIPPADWNMVQFTLTGDGNPRAQTANGDFATDGTMRWDGLSLQFDTPAPGETIVIDLELPDHIVRYEFTRSSEP